MAWPERIVLIVLAVFVMLAVEVAVLGLIVQNHGPGLAIIGCLVVSAFLDLWAVLRMIDRLYAGPARRRRTRMTWSP